MKRWKNLGKSYEVEPLKGANEQLVYLENQTCFVLATVEFFKDYSAKISSKFKTRSSTKAFVYNTRIREREQCDLQLKFLENRPLVSSH